MTPPRTERIAVVVPCRDAAPWLPDLLESLATQTRMPDDVVIVDDGSSDDSVPVVRDWLAGHPNLLGRVRIIQQSPSGVHVALARGMYETHSSLVARIDADDLVHPCYLEALEKALVDHPMAGYAYPAMVMFGEVSGRYYTRVFDAASLVMEGNFVCAGALMRREAYDAAGGVADLPAWEDWDLWLRFLEVGYEGVFVDEELYWWRRHGQTRNRMSFYKRRTLRLRIWWRHRRLVARYMVPGIPKLARRLVHPVRQQ